MPNAHSKAGHIPERTCVICRQKKEQSSLLSFFILGSDIVYDVNNRVQTRKQYVCHLPECLQRVDIWQIKRTRKKAMRDKR